MDYPPAVQQVLAKAGAAVGDTVAVTARGDRLEGVVMPHHAFSGSDILTLKLGNGYNVGIDLRDISKVDIVAKHAPAAKKAAHVPKTGKLPVLSVLGTGGTIASYVDYRTGAVHPAVTAEELVFSVPELMELADVKARAVYSVYSEDLKPANWQHLATEAAKELNGGAEAVLIPHGTDTLAFTTAALAFMIRDLPGPVILVGAQRSSDRPSSDAAMNLICGARLASADVGEVVAVMHGETGDTFCLVHRGTKVRKMHASRRDAFRSMNAAPLGTVQFDGRLELSPEVRKRAKGPAVADPRLDPEVALVWFHPGLTPQALSRSLEGAHGAVVAGTGLGHVAHDLIPVIAGATKAGTPVVVTTQTLQGRVGLRVYDTGRDLLRAGAIDGQDMLPEVALVKLMWALGRTKDPAEVARVLGTDVAGEINPRIGLDEFTV